MVSVSKFFVKEVVAVVFSFYSISLFKFFFPGQLALDMVDYSGVLCILRHCGFRKIIKDLLSSVLSNILV